MHSRLLQNKLVETAGYYPVVLVDGPRQAGKTTLCRGTFPKKDYVSLESLDNREFANSDPRGFIAEYRKGAIFDEVQNTPELISYLQDEVDNNPEPGRFILSGSQNLVISEQISQSLAGRVGILHLLPLSREEVKGFKVKIDNLFILMWTGGYPRIYDRKIPADQWLADYVATYIQRDVRQLINITDLNRFTTFLKLCAAHTAQEINLSSIGGDAGISHNTTNSWISVLEASFLCFRLPAYHRNTKKQIVKAPKLHFFDTGLVCYLLGIQTPEQLKFHPLRGAIFETWVTTEIYKSKIHQGINPQLFHYRESRGLEVDLVEIIGNEIILREAKSGETIAKDFSRGLDRLQDRLEPTKTIEKIHKKFVYGGKKSFIRNQTEITAWKDL